MRTASITRLFSYECPRCGGTGSILTGAERSVYEMELVAQEIHNREEEGCEGQVEIVDVPEEDEE